MLSHAVCLLASCVMMISAGPNDLVPSRELDCDVAQRGFHLSLRCLLKSPTDRRWDRCVMKLRLSKGLYVDPHELALQQPGLNFSLSKPRTPPKSRFGKWLSWFTGSNPHQEGRGSFDQYEAAEIPMKASEVDVESPEWLSQPMTLNLYPAVAKTKLSKKEPNAVEIPVKLRYGLPNDGKKGASLTKAKLPYPMVKCSDGDAFNNWDTLAPLEYTMISPHVSDLLYVMPVTVLLLTVGVAVLLFA